MCGIVGYVGSPDSALLTQMKDALTHRGPDAGGESWDERVSLGHRRLSIIDLAGGDQPMSTYDGSLTVVFNGEIYNFRELRKTLSARGYRFDTRSDTEVILTAYREFGKDCLRHLDGMFAFVLYDRDQHLLFGARDRFGKKPLFWTELGRGADLPFAFASELKALLRHPKIAERVRLSEAGLISYLANDYVCGEQRIYDGVFQLPAAHAFLYGLPGSQQEGWRQWAYWDVDWDRMPDEEVATFGEAEVRDRLRDHLIKAVEKRTVADVPVGALLSGGVDSSSIVSLLTRLKPANEVETFSIGFDESSFDESRYAEEVARLFGTTHHCRRFTAADLVSHLPSIVESLDEPFADASILPVSALCQFARERVTVALGGDGGDEFFAGYDPVKAVQPAVWYRRIVPKWLHRGLMQPLTRCLPRSDANMGLDLKVSRFLRGATVPAPILTATWMGAFSIEQLRRLMPDLSHRLNPESIFPNVFEQYHRTRAAGGGDLEQTLAFFQRFYLVDDILVKVDRASMLHALEVRSPFLDTELVRFVQSLPTSLKYHRGKTKHILKQALLEDIGVGPVLPERIVHRKKKGFGIPTARWIRHELRDAFRELLVEEWPTDHLPMIDRKEVHRLLDSHIARRENHAKELWALSILAMWSRNHMAIQQSPSHFSTQKTAVKLAR